MKKLLYFSAILLVTISCATTRETKLARTETRNNKQLTEQAIVKQAVESKRYIIKLDRMYFRHGGIIDLIPRANYIIVDGEKAIISSAYIGRQFDIRPISGINMRGINREYQLTKNVSKGKYEVKMVVDNGQNSFDLYLTIGKSGFCSASISNMKLDYVNYKGYLVPINARTNIPLQKGEPI